MCNNHASICGGGLYLGVPTGYSSKIVIKNNLIANNNNNGVRVRSDTSIFINNTIVNNSGYGIYSNDFSKYMSIENCISWGNQKLGISVITPEIFLLNSNIEEIQINKNPSFINPSAGYGTGYNGYSANWNLQTSSWHFISGTPDTTVGHTSTMGFTYNQKEAFIEIHLSLNPAEDTLTVIISEIPENTQLTVINMKGVVFLKQDISSKKIQLYIGDLPKGLYYVKMVSGKTVSEVRFIKK